MDGAGSSAPGSAAETLARAMAESKQAESRWLNLWKRARFRTIRRLATTIRGSLIRRSGRWMKQSADDISQCSEVLSVTNQDVDFLRRAFVRPAQRWPD